MRSTRRRGTGCPLWETRQMHTIAPLRRVVTALLLGLLAPAGAPRPAGAHPMGNFSISHYSEITVAPGEARLQYALDLAEIPTFQARQQMDGDHDGKVTRAESDAYL